MRKLLKKIAIFFLCVCMAQGTVLLAAVPQTVQAATVKKGLKKEGKYYYYYENGVKVKNTWKTVKKKVSGKTVSYRYYFGKNGRAYAAPDLSKSDRYKKNVLVKKIGKYYYGFDRNGRMVTSGYYNNPQKYDRNGDTYTYYFDKNGRYNSKKSLAIRKAGKYMTNAAAIRKILGTPKKTSKLDSCFGEAGNDYRLTYTNISVTIHRYPDGREIVFGIFPV